MHDIGTTRLEMSGSGGAGGNAQNFPAGSPFGEMQELQLASELLEVSNEAELEQFLGNLISTVGGAARQFARSDTGQALGGILKDAARQALPVIGQAAGQWVSPRYGGPIGQTVATQAGKGPEAARAAAMSAARTFAPGLLPMLRGRSGINWPRGGRWVREGRTIVLYGG
jgi:hypothetical protein